MKTVTTISLGLLLAVGSTALAGRAHAFEPPQVFTWCPGANMMGGCKTLQLPAHLSDEQVRERIVRWLAIEQRELSDIRGLNNDAKESNEAEIPTRSRPSGAGQ